MPSPKPLLPDGAEAGLFFFEGQYQFVTRSSRRYQVKFLGPQAVRSAFACERLDSGWIRPEIVRTGSAASGLFAVAFLTARKREIIVAPPGDEPFVLTVPVPPVVAIGSAAGLSLFAVRGNTFDPTAKVHYAPFPNLFADARVCWGANRQPPVDHSAIVAAVDLFFSSPFNLNEAAGRSLAYPANVVEQLRQLARRRARAYPVDDLVRVPHAGTVSAVVDQLVAGRHGGHEWD